MKDTRQSRSPTYRSWLAMKRRCLIPGDKDFRRYGGRGISICEEWKYDFKRFLADMGERPGGMTIERKDNNGDYCKNNCVWAEPKTQYMNKRSIVWIEYNGRKQCIKDWANEIEMPVATFAQRLKRGWTVEEAMHTPIDVTCLPIGCSRRHVAG